MTIFTDLISNVALLLALSILYSFLTRIWKQGEIPGQILAGILFGGVAVAGMMQPFNYAPGVIFDGRSMVVSMAGLFGGPVTAGISTLIAGGYRLGLGGTGALTGFGVIFASAALGVGYHYLRRKNPAVIKPLYLFVFGVIVHISMLLWMLTLPWPLAFEVLNKISIPVMLIFPLGTVFLGTLLVDQEERNYAQEALRESEEKYRTLIENAGEAIIVAQDGMFKFANPKGEKLYGRSQEELASRPLTDFIHDEDRNMVGERHKKRLKGEEISESYPFRIINKAGDTKWVQLSAVPFSWDNKPAVLCYVTNITDLKQAEEALRESNALLSSIIESPRNIIILSLDEDYRYTSFNTLHALEMKKVWGVDIELGKKILDYIPGKEDRERAERNYERVMKGEHIVQTEEYGELGNRYSYELVYNPIADEKNTVIGLTLFISDITQRVQAEKEKIALQDKLQRAQKMEAMGLMAGGVAHDLNNILSGIVSYPELLLMDIPEDSPMWKPIKTIQESGMRAADVVEDLMTIARGVATSKEVMNFNTVVEEYLDSTEHKNLVSIRPSVTFKTQFDSDLLNVNGSPTHMKKVLMNLVTNASEAIEGIGTVIISTTNQYLDEPLRGYEDVVTGEYVILTISDDGLGISHQDLERIFEPFYTKKVMDRSGTGLGLAVVWNTVQDHNGYINVNTSKKGTVFELYFPVTREDVVAVGEEIPLDDYLGHGEKILVVDDEERQREIASGILTRLGYNSETISSGEDAIEYVKEKPVDLILLDMVMPKGINGRKTYEEIIKIRPGQKAIIASGYAKTKEVDKAQELGAGKYIKKPYTLPKVGLAVKEELEK